MFKLKNQLQRFGLLVAGLATLMLFTTLGGLWNYQGQLTAQVSNAQSISKNTKATPQSQLASTAVSNPNQQLAEANQALAQSGTNQKPTGTGQTTVKNIAQASSNTATSSSPSTSQSTGITSQPATVSLALSVNGQTKGTVRLAAGSSQCDLLGQALADGLLGSLDMRYSSQYGTEAVYVINGVGDPNTVWWTYTVNGSPPPYGCAYITAHNGDSVNWQYIKN